MIQQVQQTPQLSFDGEEIVQLLPDSLDTFAIEIGRQAAVGLTADGRKHVWGLREGATENAEVVSSLLEELQQRGLNPRQPTWFVVDGAKALVAGVKRVFGRNAWIPGSPNHKRRNVKAHLAQRDHEELDRRLSEAYGETL